ncbi:uncharacterized protein [Fopius arisanus]|uniref:Uncharacterized protein isoform X2 n=1 Tax=Fopius arisanus TaxID=64838 RepID=A0A9R1U7F9_9HYME|nr:PREDICTED: uncharacterized protein LOC105270665 isoform X2 [Fopius arisanus]
MEDWDWDYLWESESFEDVRTLTIDQASIAEKSRVSDTGELFPQFVSKLEDERAKRAAAEEEEKRERLRKLLGLDKMKARDSAETILTPDEDLPVSESSSSESSGNICLRNIGVSDSQLKLLNIFKVYPVPDDPGLVSGFWVLFPREISYKEDGIQKFLDISARMKLRPIQRLQEMLKTDEVNLGFYGLDPRIIRPLSDAITNNTSVQTINLQENWLTVDACFHLNDLLINNGILSSINLSGCRIGPRGAKRLIDGIGRAPALQYLNVSKCQLGDEGATHICHGASESLTLRVLDLSDNDIDGSFARSLYYTLVQTETLQEINLAWNSVKSDEFWENFLTGIFKNLSLTRIDLSWNSLGSQCLRFLMELVAKAPGVEDINLSNNRLNDEDVGKLAISISKSRTLRNLSLKNNPIGPEGVLALVKSLKSSPELHLDLGNIWADKKVIPYLEGIKTVNLGGILSNYHLVGPDPRSIFLKRANFEAMKPKKKKQRRNFGHFVLSLEGSTISKSDFVILIQRHKIKLSESLVEEIAMAFAEGKDEVDLMKLKAFYLQEYPETSLPPPKPEKKKGKKSNDEAKEKTAGDNPLSEKKLTRFE